MPPGRAHQFHAHPEMEEIIYVESGTAEQWVDRTHRELKAGDSLNFYVREGDFGASPMMMKAPPAVVTPKAMPAN